MVHLGSTIFRKALIVVATGGLGISPSCAVASERIIKRLGLPVIGPNDAASFAECREIGSLLTTTTKIGWGFVADELRLISSD